MAGDRQQHRPTAVRQSPALRLERHGRTKGHAMKIQRLHLDGFGRWTDMDIEFAPGLNVIYGANEAGKSTMQQAILAMLYGLSTQRTNGQSVLEHFRPWHGSDYGGSLEYQLDSGHGFR